jgi:hypothetical protein
MTPAAEYVTLYEFSPYLIAGWPAMIVGVVGPIVAWFYWFHDSNLRQRIVLTAGTLLLLGVFGIVSLRSLIYHAETMDRLDAGAVELVEGQVTNAHCVSKERQAFTVGAESFTPASEGFQPGFESGKIFSRSLRDGMRVRIHYFDGSWGARIITKLEHDPSTGIAAPDAKLIGPCG